MRRERLPNQFTAKRGSWEPLATNLQLVLTLLDLDLDDQATGVLFPGQRHRTFNVLTAVKQVRWNGLAHPLVRDVVAHDQFSRVALETRIHSWNSGAWSKRRQAW